MPESETFDAFYARTVWSVTSQIHELAGNDGAADHAIREAYAKAYQQWYQVSGYSDAEGWVLATARDAFERRRAAAAATGQPASSPVPDSGTWPGIYRPAARPPADPESTMAPRRRDDGKPGYGPDATGGYDPDATGGPAAPGGPIPTSRIAGYPSPDGRSGGAAAGGAAAGGAATAGAGGLLGAGAIGGAALAGETAPAAPGGRSGTGGLLGPGGILGAGGPLRGSGPVRGRLTQPGSRRPLLIAAAAGVAVLLIAGITYAALGGHKSTPGSTSRTSTAGGPPKPQMLAAGKTGQRSAVPWSLVGSGWALAEFSTATPAASGATSGSGTYTTYLVDPEGGKYEIATSSGSTASLLMAWSGDAKTALLSTPAGTGASYSLLNVATGQLSPLSLPSGVRAVGFTRPDGLNILAVRQGSARLRLERYSLTGAFQRSLGSLPGKSGTVWPPGGCSYGCALSSPDGLTDVWGIFGDEMQLLDNAGGLIRKLHVPGSGQPPSCVPLSWWNDSTVLADCDAAGQPDDAAQLWLVPASGAQPTALTQPAAAGTGQIEGAWLAGQTTYVTSVTTRQCASAPSGSAGLGIAPASHASGASTISIPGTTGNVSTVVAAAGRRLLVLAQTSCPGTSSLLWFSPSAGSVTTVLTAPATQAGVIAAVPYGNGPTAVAAGQ